MTDNVEALRLATTYAEFVRDDFKFDKSEAAGKLAAFGLFTPVEINEILAWRGMGAIVPGMPKPVRRVWNISALSTLYLIALDYRAGRIPKLLVQKAARAGNSIRAISELTGVPKDDIRRAVYDDPNLLDLLRAGANPSGG